MKHRWQAAAGAVAVLAAVGATGALALDLPPEIRAATNVDASRDTIEKYVKSHLDALAGSDRKAADAARDEFYRQVENNNPAASSAFIVAYMRAASANVQALVADKDVNKRLVGAIALARLAAAAPTNPDLGNAIDKTLAVAEPSVSLWGVKAAGNMLPQLLRFQQVNATLPKRLTGGVLAAVTAHPTAGPLVQDAYNALTPPDVQPALPPTALSACVAALNDLMAARTKAYADGVPAYPQAERIATTFLTREAVLNSMSAGQQNQTVRQLVMLMVAIAAQEPNAGAAKPDFDRNIAACAGLINLVLDKAGANPARGPLRELAVLKAGAAPNLAAQLSTAVTAVKKIPAYADLKTP